MADTKGEFDVQEWFKNLPLTVQWDYGIEDFVEEYERLLKQLKKGG